MHNLINLEKDDMESLKVSMPVIKRILSKLKVDKCMSLENTPTEDLTSLKNKVECISEVESYLTLHTEKQ